MCSKIHLTNLTLEEINSLPEVDKAYRGLQIFQWISRGAGTYSEMTNLPKVFQDELDKSYTLWNTKNLETLKDSDGTIKLRIEVPEDSGKTSVIETVLLHDLETRKTACLSSQAGCPMGCKFCMTGKLGFSRNLDAGEILEQFYALEKESGTIQNIVFMGMGEPLLNLKNIRKAIEILSSPKGRNFSTRRVTISTCGIVPAIYEMAENGPDTRLAVSLTSADDEIRSSLMPVNDKYPLKELKKALIYYTGKTKKRITLEAALLGKVNTDSDSAAQLYTFAKDFKPLINLIPWNPVEGLDFSEPTEKEIRNFSTKLISMGLQVTIRHKKGRNIGGACGQLGRVSKQP